jgi:2-polyprenyl-3-methyl-5-hydroxy-6-metoxy-1,4-benzoquinol methylase
MTSANIVGNVYDKYGTRNPIARKLMDGFLAAVSELYMKVRPARVLEVGCGEGRLAHHLISLEHAPEQFDACDLSLDKLAPGLDPRIHFSAADVYRLPYQSRQFDLVVCCEVLEHLQVPERGLAELARVTSGWLLVSTPREPLWRLLNLARGHYLSDWGNTPGHVQHFSRSQLLRLLATQVAPVEVRTPLPWTLVLGRKREQSQTIAESARE